MYLVSKENILIAILLKRVIKNVDIKFSAHERFWNNFYQVAQNQKIGKPNNLIVLGAQNLWVLMLCRCQTTNSPIRAWNIYESSPFSRKKFLSLCSIVKTTEWNGLIKIDN